MTFIYVITKYLTFPGAFVRCMWEQIVCRVTKTVVEDNRYIRDDEMCSHIDHELIKSTSGAFTIGFLPFLSAIAGAVLLSLFPYVFRPMSLAGTVFSGLSVWFVISFISNCFPSVEDALNMADRIYRKGSVFAKVILTPGFAVLFIGAYLEKYCITFVAAVVGTVIAFVL